MPGTLRSASPIEIAPCDWSKALLTTVIDCGVSCTSAGSLLIELPLCAKSSSARVPLTVTGASVVLGGSPASATVADSVVAGDCDHAMGDAPSARTAAASGVYRNRKGGKAWRMEQSMRWHR